MDRLFSSYFIQETDGFKSLMHLIGLKMAKKASGLVGFLEVEYFQRISCLPFDNDLFFVILQNSPLCLNVMCSTDYISLIVKKRVEMHLSANKNVD